MGANRHEFTINSLYELVKAGLFPAHGEGFMVQDSLFKEVDWDEVYQLAQEQSVQGLVLQGIDRFKVHDSRFMVPQVLLLQWIGEVQVIEQRNIEMNAFVADIIEKLRKENVHPILVKGQGIAQCYEKPLLRTCGDVDLLMSEDDYEKARMVLIPLAAKVETEYESSKHLGLVIDGWTVELHGRLRGSLSRRINRELESIQVDTFKRNDVRVWNNGGVPINLLGKENDIVYVFVHFLNHFYKEGVGLRQICDWCRLLWTYRDEMDKKKIESRIRRMGLVSEWKAFGAFSVNHLGMPIEAMPFLNMDECTNLKKKADRICSFIMEVGNFGHNRDTSYYGKYPFVVRKAISAWWRTKDLFRHIMIFPLDSLRFFPYILWNGLKSAVRGE